MNGHYLVIDKQFACNIKLFSICTNSKLFAWPVYINRNTICFVINPGFVLFIEILNISFIKH